MAARRGYKQRSVGRSRAHRARLQRRSVFAKATGTRVTLKTCVFAKRTGFILDGKDHLSLRGTMGYAMRDEGIESGSFGTESTGLHGRTWTDTDKQGSNIDDVERGRNGRRRSTHGDRAPWLEERGGPIYVSAKRTHFELEDFFIYSRYSQALMSFAEGFANGFVLEKRTHLAGLSGLKRRELDSLWGQLHAADS